MFEIKYSKEEVEDIIYSYYTECEKIKDVIVEIKYEHWTVKGKMQLADTEKEVSSVIDENRLTKIFSIILNNGNSEYDVESAKYYRSKSRSDYINGDVILSAYRKESLKVLEKTKSKDN